MQMSPNGKAFTKLWETLRLAAYRATQNEKHLTIGWGHYGADVRPNQIITPQQADKLFDQDIQKAIDAVNSYAHPSISQAQFDALVDHCYNLGNGSIKPDNILGDFDDQVRNGNWKEVRKRFMEFNKQRNTAGKLVPLLGLTRRCVGRQSLFDGKSADDAYADAYAVKKA